MPSVCVCEKLPCYNLLTNVNCGEALHFRLYSSEVHAKCGVVSGIDVRALGLPTVLMWPGGVGAISQGRVCLSPCFGSDFYGLSSFEYPFHLIQCCTSFGCYSMWFLQSIQFWASFSCKQDVQE